jgi:hypothetical protein
MKTKTYLSRYGDKRILTENGHGWYTIEGEAHFTRGSEGMFDADGGIINGNALYVGADYGFGKIISMTIEPSGKENYFKVRVETEQ